MRPWAFDFIRNWLIRKLTKYTALDWPDSFFQVLNYAGADKPNQRPFSINRVAYWCIAAASIPTMDPLGCDFHALEMLLS